MATKKLPQSRGERMKEVFKAASEGRKITPMTDAQRKAAGLPTKEKAKEQREFKQLGKVLRQPIRIIKEAARIVTETPEVRNDILKARAAETGTHFVKRGNPNFGKTTKSFKKRISKKTKDTTSIVRRGRPPGTGKMSTDKEMDKLWTQAFKEAKAEMPGIISKSLSTGSGKRRGRPPGSKNR